MARSTMPHVDGIELVRRLRAAGNAVPVVLCSGDLELAVERGLTPGTAQKPFSTAELLTAIERAREPSA